MASPEYVDRIIAENSAAMRKIGAEVRQSGADLHAAVARRFAWTIAILVATACASVVVACFI